MFLALFHPETTDSRHFIGGNSNEKRQFFSSVDVLLDSRGRRFDRLWLIHFLVCRWGGRGGGLGVHHRRHRGSRDQGRGPVGKGGHPPPGQVPVPGRPGIVLHHPHPGRHRRSEEHTSELQ